LLLLAAASVAIVIALVSGQPGQLGGCGRVDIYTGHVDSPYFRYAQVLKNKIENRFPGTAVTVQDTSGTSDNINRLGDVVTASCELAVIQLNVGVDARSGRYDFAGKPVKELRTVGPLWFDLIHLLVRQDSGSAGIRDVTDLCGKKVATGVGGSGVKQIGDVLFRQAHCAVTLESAKLPDGLKKLREGEVDAVLWAGGSPTQMIKNAINDGLAVRLIPLDPYLESMQMEWRRAYPSAGDIYRRQSIKAGDYPGTGTTDILTVAAPNGVAVNNAADPSLVRFVADTLVRDRTDFEHALWGDAQGARHFLTPNEAITNSPLYCVGPPHSDDVIPLHPDAESYYKEMGVRLSAC
jgi:TRAP transporter TAXI family solute receptor